MAEPVSRGTSPRRGNVLTEKLGPLPVWAWGLGGTVLVVGYLYYRKKKAAAATTTAATTGTGTVDTSQGYTPSNYGMSGYGMSGGGGSGYLGAPAPGPVPSTSIPTPDLTGQPSPVQAAAPVGATASIVPGSAPQLPAGGVSQAQLQQILAQQGVANTNAGVPYSPFPSIFVGKNGRVYPSQAAWQAAGSP